jgi:hypothetical protein
MYMASKGRRGILEGAGISLEKGMGGHEKKKLMNEDMTAYLPFSPLCPSPVGQRNLSEACVFVLHAVW